MAFIFLLILSEGETGGERFLMKKNVHRNIQNQHNSTYSLFFFHANSEYYISFIQIVILYRVSRLEISGKSTKSCFMSRIFRFILRNQCFFLNIFI